MSAALTVWVPIKPVNPLNTRESHFTRWKRSRKERDALAMALYVALNGRKIEAKPERAKVVTFTVHAAKLFDEGDNLAAVCKNLRDELVPLGLISGDAPKDGHLFTYAQRVATPTGVEIRVALA